MLFDKLRAAIGAASQAQLAEVGEAMWRAFGAGSLSEVEATALQGMIETRGATHQAAPGPAPVARVGARPRSGASLERRRRWAASGWMPAALAARFTPSEAAVLAVIAHQTSKSGDCRLPHGMVAALAGVSRSTVKAALREARRLGLLTAEERRVSRCRSLTNIVRIASPEWSAWLAHRAGRSRPATVPGGGGKSPSRTNTSLNPIPSSAKKGPLQSAEGQTDRQCRDQREAA